MKRCKQLMAFLLLFISTGSLYGQQRISTTGKILSEDGAQLESATIKVVNVNTGAVTHTISDSIGVFKISDLIPGEKYNLFFDYVGYDTDSLMNVSFSQTENSSLLIRLKPDSRSTLGDVVVTALGIRRSEQALSYSTQKIDADGLSVKDANFVNSLQGKVAGVTINTSSSGVGGATKVVMRGTKSIAKDNNALYVIDGVPMFNVVGSQGSGRFDSQGATESAADINPEDIESLTILTGASAAALYGSNAANGVILITTKSGKEGRLSLNYSSQADFMSPFVMPAFQNIYSNNPGEIKSWGPPLKTPSTYDPSNFFRTGKSLINSLSLSTGTAKNQTFFSASSTNSNGLVQNNTYNRYNFTIRNTAKFLDDKLTFDASANYIRQSDKNMRNQGEYFSSLVPVYLFPRGEDFSGIQAYERWDEARLVSLPYWPFGEGGFSMQNPYWTANRIIVGSDKDRYILSGSLKYNILPWLNISTRTRFDNAVVQAQDKRYAGTLLQFTGNSPKGFWAHSTGTEKQIYTDVMLSANKSINNYSMNVNAGSIYSDMQNNVRDGFRAPLKEDGISNFFSPYNQRFTGQDANPIVGYSALRTYSLFFSGEFGYKKMVYLTLTGRNDWASPLVNTNTKSFFYPSVGLSAIMNQLLDLPSAISFLKIRGSYAQVGNPPTAGLTSPTYSYNTQTGIWTPPSYMPIEALYPERTDSWEAGLNARFLRSKITLDITYYKSNTYKQTFNPTISSSSGYNSMYIQTGNISNTGVESVLGYSDDFGDFSYQTKLTFSTNKNKIIELADNYLNPVTGEISTIKELRMGGLSDAQFVLRKGGSLGDLYSYLDINRDENGQIFVNATDGSISSRSNVENYLGSVFPKSNWGWNNEFSYKGISFGFVVAARFGGIVLSSTQAVLDNFGVSKESANWRDKGGIPVNEGYIDTKKWYEVIAGGQGMMAYYTYSATNARLQEMHLNYQLPKKWFKNIVGITVGVNARNLWMIYNKAPFDPEATASTGNFYQGMDYFMMPSLRNIGLNLKVQF